MTAPALLRVQSLSKHYGGLRAVDDLSLTLDDGELVGIIGPNGAGKTTLFDLLSGLTSPSGGRIFFKNTPIHGMSADQICHLGLVRTFQTAVAFATQTVFRNVLVGALFGREQRQKDADPYSRAYQALELVGLMDKAALQASELGILDQKRLMLATALATSPQVVLLDEPMSGLTRDEMLESVRVLRVVHGLGISVVFIEHVMEAVLTLAQRVVVLDHGRLIFDGAAQRLAENAEVRRVYLGLDHAGVNNLAAG